MNLNFEELELLLELPVLGVELLDGEIGVYVSAGIGASDENWRLWKLLLSTDIEFKYLQL